MLTIETIAKYDEKTGKFTKDVKLEDRLLALSKITTSVISDESNDKFEYILFINGNRAKDITKDGLHPDKERDYCQIIADYFKEKKKNVLIESILLDNDSPLNLETMMFAEYIDDIASRENIGSINIIGHSKCGAIAFNIPKYFHNVDSFAKTSITTTATPFNGCIIASSTIFLRQVEELINSQLPKPLNGLVFSSLKNYYMSLSSGAHMDNDIALPGYVSDRYDSSFISDMFDLNNIIAINKVRNYRNFITGVDDATLIKYLRKGDFTSVGLCLIDKYFMTEKTDGFIEVSSQESVNQHFDHPSTNIESTSHYFLSHPEEFSIVLDYINSDIDEYKDQEGFRRRLL